jgi:hypothetical protein
MNNPWLIFVIGTSCSGKSSFADTIKTDEYTYLDDATPLYKFFKADVLLSSGAKEFQNFIKENNIESFYTAQKTHSYAVDTGGYRITNPAVWDYVLQLTAKEVLVGNKYIIEFSRGIDPVYMKAFNVQPKDVYKRAFANIIDNIPDSFKDNSLIINIQADFESRVNRNFARREKGGHFVNIHSMNTIYKSEIFEFEHINKNAGFFNSIPVYSFQNKESENQKTMFLKNYQNALNFYHKVKNER